MMVSDKVLAKVALAIAYTCPEPRPTAEQAKDMARAAIITLHKAMIEEFK